MFDIKPDDLVYKQDMLLYDILQELKQLNKSLHPMRKGEVAKKKSKPKAKAKPIDLTKDGSAIK